MAVFVLVITGIFALLAALFHGALLGGSPLRIEDINNIRKTYKALPDLDDAARAAGCLKVILYVLAAGILAVFAGSAEGRTVGFVMWPVLLVVALVVVLEAAAVVVGGFQSGEALYRLVPLIAVFEKAGRALSASGSKVARVMSRLAGESHLPEPPAAEDEMLDALSEGEREGVIAEGEREMIEGIIEFKDVEVSEVMTPRTETVTVDADSTLREILPTVAKSGYSRLPVWSENYDNIVGVLYVKDVVGFVEPDDLKRTVRSLMRRPYFVPATKMVRELLEEFRRTTVHMAIVLDEYGGTSGIVTIEDIIEEIVGEIEDEYDEYEPPDIRSLGARRAVVEGDTPVDEVNETLGINLPENEEYETLAGYILFRTGRVPSKGEILEWEGVSFTIFEADLRRIRRVLVEVKDSNARAEET